MAADPVSRFPGRDRAGRRERAAHPSGDARGSAIDRTILPLDSPACRLRRAGCTISQSYESFCRLPAERSSWPRKSSLTPSPSPSPRPRPRPSLG
jgi:hypothetical protein